LNNLNKFEQLQSLMMGYEWATIHWNKDSKSWVVIIMDDDRENCIITTNLDNTIKILLNSDL